MINETSHDEQSDWQRVRNRDKIMQKEKQLNRGKNKERGEKRKKYKEWKNVDLIIKKPWNL